MFIVIYRAPQSIETQYIGPFTEYAEAYNALCEMPTVSVKFGDGISGVKYVQELTPTLI